MVLMENGRMDPKSGLSTNPDRFIVISGKRVKSCFNADSTVAFQDVDNDKSMTAAEALPVSENNFPNYKGNTFADDSNSNITMGIVNGDDSSSNHESRTCIILKTNSSQCNANSQKSCCTKLENELSSLSISNREFVVTSKTCIDQCLEFCDVITEIATDQRITDGVNGSSDEISSTRAVDSNSLNAGGNVEEQSEGTSEITYISYESENQMPDIMKLIQKDLSEPYSIYTYRYFIHNWPHLCFLAVSNGESVGAIVCKLDLHRKIIKRGYIAMLAVDECFRKKGIGSNLVLKAIRVMATEGADEVVLETEITNQPALRLYENLGFVRDKRLFRYYLNGVDALRLKLWLR